MSNTTDIENPNGHAMCEELRKAFHDLHRCLHWLVGRSYRYHGCSTEIQIGQDPRHYGGYKAYLWPEHVDYVAASLFPNPGCWNPDEHGCLRHSNVSFTPHGEWHALPLLHAGRFFSEDVVLSTGDIPPVYAMFSARVCTPEADGCRMSHKEWQARKQVAAKIQTYFSERDIPSVCISSGDAVDVLVPTAYDDFDKAYRNGERLFTQLSARFSQKGHAVIDPDSKAISRALPLPGVLTLCDPAPGQLYPFALLETEHLPEDVDLFGILKKDMDEFEARQRK